MQFQSLSAWLGWLEQCHPCEIDLGLARIARVAQVLDLLTPSAIVITVAGTNGKGSCVTATAALLRAAGHSVGVYTSPHLISYNERIQVDAASASDDEICAAFEAIFNACQLLSAADGAPLTLTYFEYGTLAALEVFRRRKVSAMVLEVGLGGRLDAINILAANIAVITSIDIDHQDWLGDNRELIGYEKAGIMRAERQAICADPQPPQSITAYAQTVSAPLLQIGHDFGFEVDQASDSWSWWSAATRFDAQPLPHLPLPSVAAALQVAHCLGLDLMALDAFKLVSELRVPGRFQVVEWEGRQCILDVAHNPAATAYLAQRLINLPKLTCEQESSKARTFAIVAMMSDKDRTASLANLIPLVDVWYLADLSDIPRAANPQMLIQDLQGLGRAAEFCGSVEQCLMQLLAASKAGDRIIICGSFYTVAAGLKLLQAF